VSHRRALRGEVLDFGCGPGFLTEKLLRRGLCCTALDFSADSVAMVAERLASFDNLARTIHATGLPTDLASRSFDTIFLVETIEHLLPADRDATLTELARLARPGGWLVVTTPHDEDLDSHKVICPECGAVFHQRQHVTSWTAASLSTLLAEFGFDEHAATPLTLRPRSLLNPLRTLVSRARGDKPKHLVCLAKRRG
jgi:2-polyprenyl-3-methyl-5-hydroxy-6-metoxy-1,4-benzoquinol methylase